MAELEELLARVVAATGPDRELDAAIAVALDGLYVCEPRPHDQGPRYGYIDKAGDRLEPGQAGDMLVRPYTAGVDVALALVERKLPGCWWTLGRGRTRPDEPLFGMILLKGDADYGDPDGYLSEGEHEASLPLAILIALLTAAPVQRELDRRRGERG